MDEGNVTQCEQVVFDDVPKRNTTSLELLPNEKDKAEIARNQLLSLTKKPTRKKISPSTSDNEVMAKKDVENVTKTPVTLTDDPSSKDTIAQIIYDGKPTMGNLSSAIISKEEIEQEIRKKIATTPDMKKDNNNSFDIEIPQELILSEIPAESTLKPDEERVQLNEQELIDILEGNPENDGETYEVIGENGMFIVKPTQATEEVTSYEIVSPAQEELAQNKKKMLERQIAIQQMASMPKRKKRQNLTNTPHRPQQQQTQQSLAQTLAMDWSDKEEEVLFEVENVESSTNSEPKIKILNMTILNDCSKNEPKILNINAPKSPPKILNKNAPQSSFEPATFKSSRVIKKKQIWDPSVAGSSSTPLSIEKSPPITLPSAITIKKLTKETIKEQQQQNQQQISPPTKKGKKKSEIDKLFQDEGAVNMIYSLERRNNNRDVPEVKVTDNNAFVDVSEEKSALIAKQQSIRQAIIKQSSSPPEVKTPSRPQRVKRDLTPSKPAIVASPENNAINNEEKSAIVAKAKKNSIPARRKKTDDSWDYVRNAQTTCDDAMIIRRHSSSSYSSSAPTSPRRLSIEQFTKPHEKKSSLESPQDLKKSAAGLVEELRNTLSTALAKGKNQAAKGGKKRVGASQDTTPAKRERRTNVTAASGETKEFSVNTVDGIAHINLSSNCLTLPALNELKTILKNFETDTNCKVVLFTASDELSHGLDHSTLLQTTVDKRKQAANALSIAVNNFFTSLAAYPKITICGVKGLSSGIGVTMLPLFDVVIAEQNAKFSLPCNHVEGISILQLSQKINANIVR